MMVHGGRGGGKNRELEALAVSAAIRGERVRLVTKDGDLVLEPGTGNIASVALREVTEMVELDETLDASRYNLRRISGNDRFI